MKIIKTTAITILYNRHETIKAAKKETELLKEGFRNNYSLDGTDMENYEWESKYVKRETK